MPPAAPLGWHWLAQATGCDPAALEDATALEHLLSELARQLSLTVMVPPRVQPIDGGLAGVVLLGESHASVHTRAADRAALVDVFSCIALDPHVADAVLRAHLRPEAVRADLVERRSP